MSGYKIPESRMAIVRLVEHQEAKIEQLTTQVADLEKKLAVAKGALEKSSNFIIQDGCEECSSIWERSYQFKPAIEALAAIEQGSEG